MKILMSILVTCLVLFFAPKGCKEDGGSPAVSRGVAGTDTSTASSAPTTYPPGVREEYTVMLGRSTGIATSRSATITHTTTSTPAFEADIDWGDSIPEHWALSAPATHLTTGPKGLHGWRYQFTWYKPPFCTGPGEAFFPDLAPRIGGRWYRHLPDSRHGTNHRWVIEVAEMTLTPRN